MDGWIKLHRKMALPGSSFIQLTAIQKLIAIFLLMHANHKDGEWIDKRRNVAVPVKRGQLITSRNTIMSWFDPGDGVTNGIVRGSLERLEFLKFLTKQGTSTYTLITIVNYGVYQDSPEDVNQVESQTLTKSSPSPNQVENHKQEVKKEKNVKEVKEKEIKEYVQVAPFVKMYKSEYRTLVEKHGLEYALEIIEELNHYKHSHGKQYASDYGAINSWIARRKREEGNKHGRYSKGDKGLPAANQPISQGRIGRLRPSVPVREVQG